MGVDVVDVTSTMSNEERYFDWLKSQVGIEYGRRTSRTYEDLFRCLFSKEFVWIIPNDDNRLEDGLDLRTEFLGGGHYDVLPNGVSILEVLVALSRRLAFNAEGDPRMWAWRLLENLEIHSFVDPLTPQEEEILDDMLETMIWRQFGTDGVGSFFPLQQPKEDQREVEMWYQMSAYINENSDH
jgi:hypothetical protein